MSLSHRTDIAEARIRSAQLPPKPIASRVERDPTARETWRPSKAYQDMLDSLAKRSCNARQPQGNIYVVGDLTALQKRVLDAVVREKMTCSEIEAVAGLRSRGASGSLEALMAKGYLQKSWDQGKRQFTRTDKWVET